MAHRVSNSCAYRLCPVPEQADTLCRSLSRHDHGSADPDHLRNRHAVQQHSCSPAVAWPSGGCPSRRARHLFCWPRPDECLRPADRPRCRRPGI
ncbi:hypothetical protein [Hoeflea ulvae]|uniref:hypothetical protein n=1 Tax=Hoeflea ulvae TaxID=2983764 RepID=UPI003CCD9952